MMQKLPALSYPLDARGTVTHWLKCGVLTTPLENLEATLAPTGSPFGDEGRWVMNYWAWDERSKRLKRRIYGGLPDPFAAVAAGEHGLLDIEKAVPIGASWEWVVTDEDQVIDFSAFNFTPTLMQGWLLTNLYADVPIRAHAELLTIGPARVFLNGRLHTHYADSFSYVALQRVPLMLELQAGETSICLQGDMLGWREARLALGLRFSEPYPIAIHSPNATDELDSAAWMRAEDMLDGVQVRQFAFPTLPGYIWLDARARSSAALDVEVELPIPENVFAQLRSLPRPKGQVHLKLEPGERGELPLVTELTAGMSKMPGENSLMLTVRPADGTPLVLEREIWAGSNAFSHAPYGDYDQRRAEALHHLAAMPFDVPATLAALELGAVDQVSAEAVSLACHFMENRYDCADFYAIGLLALMYRYGQHPALRESERARIEAAFLGFKYWLDEPGLDAMCYFTENHQILFHVAAYLAGQLWPSHSFQNSGWTGRQQMARNRPRIENWIRRRLQGSFSEWDSNAYMALDAFAMLAMAEFAQSARLREMATALLNKLFFLLACQSFRGAHASTHGRCYVTALKSARVENTSSLQRIAWGMGIFNGETRATGLLALARAYRVPDVLQSIGADTERVLVTQARSYAQFRLGFDMRSDHWDVRTQTYRTPEVMLSAALDYQPGEMGIQEHLWQATLGPEAVVFTTYPGNSQEHGNARPNFWAGSARLPRVGMTGRTVICLYRLEPDVGLGISHAYFPTAMFDEWRVDGQWAFARVGLGYIALWGDGELALTDRGRHVAQELRSRGAGQAWVCHVGRAADDGDFAAFQRALLAHPPQASAMYVSWMMPRGQTIQFGWEGALRVDGRPEDWENYPHYANAYTHTPLNAEQMTINYSGDSVVLDLRRGKTILGASTMAGGDVAPSS
jgi:hypothetical protein